MDYNLWITTIIFLSFMLAAQVVSVGLCALNTATIPIETFVGPMGIYVANFIAGNFILKLYKVFSVHRQSTLQIETFRTCWFNHSFLMGWSLLKQSIK